MEARLSYTFEKGAMWEEYPIQIHFDEEVTRWRKDDQPCKHCHSQTEVINKRHDGSTYENYTWICPIVIQAHNEGDCNSTGVCYDCIKEAMISIENKTVQPDIDEN